MVNAEGQSVDRSEQNKAGLSLELRAKWLVDQARAIRAAEERVDEAITELEDKKRELGRFIARHSSPEVWGLLPGEAADEVVSCMPKEGGYFGLEPEEGAELYQAWLERTGLDPNDLIAAK